MLEFTNLKFKTVNNAKKYKIYRDLLTIIIPVLEFTSFLYTFNNVLRYAEIYRDMWDILEFTSFYIQQCCRVIRSAHKDIQRYTKIY